MYDMGDILFDATIWRRRLRYHLAESQGITASYREMFAVWDDMLVDVHLRKRDYDEAFRAFLGRLGLTGAALEETIRASLAMKQEIEVETRPFPDVPPTLEELDRRGYVQAVLSDTEAGPGEIRTRLDSWSIGRFFPHILTSADLGYRKPSPDAYASALGAMGLVSGECAFVGHDEDELDGAAAAGIMTIAFNYEPGVTADIHIDRFAELTEVLP